MTAPIPIPIAPAPVRVQLVRRIAGGVITAHSPADARQIIAQGTFEAVLDATLISVRRIANNNGGGVPFSLPAREAEQQIAAGLVEIVTP